MLGASRPLSLFFVALVATTTSSIAGSSASASAVGEPVTFTVLVSGEETSGAVALHEGTTTLVDPCTPRAPGTWTCTTSFTTPGPHELTAVHGTSTSAVFTHTVEEEAAGGSIAFVAPAAPSATLGEAVTFTVRVSGGDPRPSGTVAWSLVSQPAGSPEVTLPAPAPALPEAGPNEVSLTVPPTELRAGAYVLRATYSGDASYPSTPSATFTKTILRAPSSFVVTRSPAGALHYGDAVTFTATSGAHASGVVPAGGTVTFTDAIDGVLGSAAVDAAGVAAVTPAQRLSVGDGHVVTATYDATNDPNLGPGAAELGPFAVAPAELAVTLLPASVSPSRPGHAVTFSVAAVPTKGHGQPNGVATIVDTFDGTATTLCGGGGAPACTRTVTGADDGALYSVTTSALALGTHAISATYDVANDPRFAFAGAVAESPRTHAVDPTVPSIVITSSVNPSVIRQSVTFRAIVSVTSGPLATGDVTFQDGTTVLGAAPLTPESAASSASFSTTALGAGQHGITARFGGATATIAHLVVKASTKTDLVAAPDPAPLGEPVVLTARVTSGLAEAIGGTVTFKDGAVMIATTNVGADGVASYVAPSLAAGEHALTAEYGGDAVFASSAGALALTVGATAPPPPTVTPPEEPVVPSDAGPASAPSTSSGGCSAAPGRAGAGPSALAAAVAIAVARRRRRRGANLRA
ncbi:MAG: Ig-like domain repeat protein [Labilithrix sp.]|nr:Ig-like domain repeat protein [Labilithrix sp.]MCW5813477.1 Ig-like domain repeat protein [Labilithrix sp.]